MNVSYDASYINAGTLVLRGCCVVVNAGNKVFSFFLGGGVGNGSSENVCSSSPCYGWNVELKMTD